MERPDDGEEQQRASQQIAAEADEVEQQAHHQHPLPGEAVYDEPTEGPHQQRRQRIARQHQADHVLRRAECLAQIQRQQRCQQIKGERHREVRRHHLPVVAVPEPLKFLFHGYTIPTSLITGVIDVAKVGIILDISKLIKFFLPNYKQ